MDEQDLTNMTDPKFSEVIRDFKRSKRFFQPIFDEVKKDFEFTLGKQWKDEDVHELEKAGRPVLTINKIKPMIKLMSGIERQSRSDLVAFPEGEEDGVASDITTKLLKHVSKRSRLVQKTSEQFKVGITGGLSWLEGYWNETDGERRIDFKNVSPLCIYIDPETKEYDLSDCKYLIKFTKNLSKEQLKTLFPDDEAKIEKVGKKTLSLDEYGETGMPIIETDDYPELSKIGDDDDAGEGYDLIEYYYKKRTTVDVLVDNQGARKEVTDKTMAEAYVAAYGAQLGARIVKEETTKYCVRQIVGNTVMYDGVCSTYPRWKGFPFFPYFAEFSTVDVSDRHLMIQGVPRGLRSLQFEYNKRRSQELAHLNSTVNSGWWYFKNSLSKRVVNALRKLGSAPGFLGEVDGERSNGQLPQRITPQPLSQGHAQLAAENAGDLKEISGVNPDLLANDSQSQSGRAILLKQRQGLVMVQELLDNYSETKKLIGRFIISQLGEAFDIEKSVRVIGEQFFKRDKMFHSPVTDEIGQPVVNPQTGELETELDMQIVSQVLEKILNDTSLGVYDVTVGEGAYNETTKMANYASLMEMVDKGFPIPPEVIVNESNLPESSKNKILQAIQAQQAAIAQKQQAQPQEIG